MNVRLPLGFGVEFGAMYKRFHQQAGKIVITTLPGVHFNPDALDYSATGQSWEFPLLGQYRFSLGAVHPYVEAGVSWNHLSNTFGPFLVFINSPPSSGELRPDGGSEFRTGFASGAGLEFKLPFGRVTPGFRYTRYEWLSGSLPATNSVDFLIGFASP